MCLSRHSWVVGVAYSGVELLVLLYLPLPLLSLPVVLLDAVNALVEGLLLVGSAFRRTLHRAYTP